MLNTPLMTLDCKGNPELEQRQVDQQEWLEKELEIGGLCAFHTIVFGHHPIDCAPKESGGTSLDASLLKLMKDNKVKLYLSGHCFENRVEEVEQSPTNAKESDSDENDDDDTDDGNDNDLKAEPIPFRLVSTSALGYPSKEPGFRVIELNNHSIRCDFYTLDQMPSQITQTPD